MISDMNVAALGWSGFALLEVHESFLLAEGFHAEETAIEEHYIG